MAVNNTQRCRNQESPRFKKRRNVAILSRFERDDTLAVHCFPNYNLFCYTVIYDSLSELLSTFVSVRSSAVP